VINATVHHIPPPEHSTRELLDLAYDRMIYLESVLTAVSETVEIVMVDARDRCPHTYLVLRDLARTVEVARGS
jgi:hypothetical protein